jgi:four helix bundle protein
LSTVSTVSKWFISELSDAETEACETQVHLDFSQACGYITAETTSQLSDRYEQILSQIVLMIDNADSWMISSKPPAKR